MKQLLRPAVFFSMALAALLLTGCLEAASEAPEAAAPDTPETKPQSAAAEASEPAPSPEAVNYQRAAVFVQAMETLHHRYVDSDKVDYDRLFEAAMHGMASALDPYSDYESPAGFEANEYQRTGEMTGIGVELVKPAGKPFTVVGVLPGSPAEKAGIHAGDLISEVDSHPVKPLNFAQAVKLIRGIDGTSVALRIVRPAAENHEETITVTRGRIVRPSIPPDAVKVLTDHVGYLKIENFTPHTVSEFDAALARLKKQHITSLVIDLRGNPGGVVSAAAGVAARLLPPGKLLFTAKHRGEDKVERVVSDGPMPRETKLPLVLLVNSFSASSAELFSAALRDNGRAKLVGMRTFGKATLLRVAKLPDGGALRYASGRYLTPAGHEIERRGIVPDVVVNLKPQQLYKLSAQSRQFPGVVKPDAPGAVEDIQLKKALELLKAPPAPPEAEKPEKPAPEAAVQTAAPAPAQ